MQRAWNTNFIIHNCKYERERPLLRAQNGRSEHCRWCLAGVCGHSEAPDSGFQAFCGIIFQKQADAGDHTKDHRSGHMCKSYFPKMAVRSENHFGETNLNVFWNCRIPRSDILDFCSVHFRFFIFSPWFCLGRCWAEWGSRRSPTSKASSRMQKSMGLGAEPPGYSPDTVITRLCDTEV